MNQYKPKRYQTPSIVVLRVQTSSLIALSTGDEDDDEFGPQGTRRKSASYGVQRKKLWDDI